MDRLRLPIGFAHRGARAERRENTLPAFVRALELGARGLESDAWLTADGEVALDHDGVIGPPWRRRPIAELVRTELPPHIPLLRDLYSRCGTAFELSLDLKDPAALEAVLHVARQAGDAAPGHLWICHPSPPDLVGHEDVGTAHLVASTRLDRIPEGLGPRLDFLAASGVAALNLPGTEWTRDRVEATHAAGLLAFGWDAQTRPAIARLVDLGVDGIYSDHVDRLVLEISRRW